MDKRFDTLKILLICAVLAGGTIVAFWGVTDASFVNIDDPKYVINNVRLHQGLSGENVKWAFTTFYFSNWHPLTWLSYLLDCQLFGPNPAAMHNVNLGLHVLNAMLLLVVLKRITGALWASVVVAGLFALHPLHVESVAWIAERKDVLSTLFWILSLGAYVEYVRRRCAGWYTLGLVFFALGLMAKPMLVTLPFVLLLIDFWPLNRTQGEQPWLTRWRRLFVEKIPFFVLAAVSAYVTFLAQSQGQSVQTLNRLPVTERVENAIVSYARYLQKTFWPTDLTVYYPHPGEWDSLQVVVALLVVIAISAFVILSLRRRPYLFVGWCWFLGTLVPVIGIVQVGSQSMADRYTYIPHIGLFMAVVWAGREFVGENRWRRFAAVGLSAAVFVGLGVLTYRQTGYWKNSVSLLSHAERIIRPHPLILNNLGDALAEEGRIEEAMARFKQVIRIHPEDPLAVGNIGNIYLRQGKLEEAIEQFRTALRYSPKSGHLSYNLGLALAANGHPAEAIPHYHRALEVNPYDLNAYLNLGNAHLILGNAEAAATNYLTILKLKPADAGAHYNVGNVRLKQGRLDEAIQHFSEAVRLDKQFGQAFYNLAAALQQAGRKAEAVKQLERAVALDPGDIETRAQLAALLTSTGQAEAAVTQYREILKANPNATPVLNNLAWMLATHPNEQVRDGAEAVRLAERAVQMTERKEAFFLGTLAAAYAEARQFDKAVQTAQEAIKVAEEKGQKEVVSKNRDLLAAYREERAWRESPTGP